MKCPNCSKMNHGTNVCTQCTEVLDVGVARWIQGYPGWTGDAALYKLDPPYEFTGLDEEGENLVERSTEYVIISATFGMTGPETIIVEATEDGPRFTDFNELDQPVGLKALDKLVGRMDHREILPDYEFLMKYPDRADYAE